MSCSSEALHTKPKLSRYVYYKLMTLIPVSAAVIGISRYAESWIWLWVYVGLCLSHALVMNAVKCPHCPYYKMGQNTFSCFMWWRMLRLYKPRAGLESRFVGIYAPIGMLILTIYPTLWLWRQWELLFLYLLSVVVVVLSIGENECSRCLNFECSHNTVSDTVKKEYQELVEINGDEEA